MGIAAGQLVTTPQLLWRVQRRGGPNLWRACLAPAVSASASMAFGWWICKTLNDTLLAGVAALLAALALQVLLVWLTDRAALKTCWSTIKRATLLVLPARLIPQRSPNRKKTETEGVGLDRAVDQASLLTSVKERVVPSRATSHGRRHRERYDREPLRDRLRSRLKPDRRTYKFAKEPLLWRVRASIQVPRPHAHALRHPRGHARDAAVDLSRKVRNRAWLVRIACAGGAIALMLLLISGHGSPNSQPQAFHPSGTSGATSASDTASRDNTAVPATSASPAPTSKRHVAKAHRTQHAAVATHHPTHVAPSSTTTHPSTTPASTGAPASSTPSTSSNPAPTTHHPSSNPTTTTPKHSASTQPKKTSKPTTGSAANPCSASGVSCQGGLIFGEGAATIATAPAIGIGVLSEPGRGEHQLVAGHQQVWSSAQLERAQELHRRRLILEPRRRTTRRRLVRLLPGQRQPRLAGVPALLQQRSQPRREGDHLDVRGRIVGKRLTGRRLRSFRRIEGQAPPTRLFQEGPEAGELVGMVPVRGPDRKERW